MSDRQVGTVEITRTRIYPVNPGASVVDIEEVTAVVSPGIYPLYTTYPGLYYWVMTGAVNARRFERLGNGTFFAHPHDAPTDAQVTFPSRTFDAEEFSDLMENDDIPLKFTLAPGRS